ncbi:MAG: efflux RND transporter permease subunit, partial [Sphingomonadales bacterium]|nr:efflux RND transporter permease subunit [Sphingomonadales bacterium]
DPAPLTMIETTIRLKPKSEWRDGMTMAKLKAELDQLVTVPSMANVWIMPIKNRIDMLSTGIKTPVGLKIAGPDLNVIASIGEEIEAVIGKVEGTTSVYAERVTGGRYVNIEVDRLAAARHGMNIADVQGVVKTAIGGMSVSQSVEGLERYPINLRYPQTYRDSLDALENMPVVTQTGAIVPLGNLATISVENGPGVIRSENARLNGWVYIDIQGRDIGTYVAAAKQAVAEHIDLPTGYSLSWSGQYEYMERAIEKLKTVVPVMLVIIMVLLFMNFKNFPSVAIIMGTLPMALVGGFWLIHILGYNMSVAVGVGFIALAGVTVETGVLMIVYLEQALKEARSSNSALEEKDVKEAVIHGALSRVRPILITVASTIVGLMPILLGTGTGSEVMSRIAAPMVGGMVSATALTLLVIPAVY